MALIPLNFQSASSSVAHFLNAIQFEPLIKLFSFLVPTRRASKAVLATLRVIAKRQEMTIEIVELQRSGVLIPEHFCIAVALRKSSETGVGSSFSHTFASGSGDAKTREQAEMLAVFELLERFTYQEQKLREPLKHAIAFTKQGTHSVHKEYIPLSTTGTAVHSVPSQAVLSGLLEVVERDAYLCHWYSGIRPEQVRPVYLSEFRYAEEKARERGLSLAVFRLRSVTPQLHTVLVTVFDPQMRFENNGFCSGLATSQSFDFALKKAFFELDRFVNARFEVGPHWKDVFLSEDHPMFRFYYYLSPERLPDLDIFLSNENLAVDLQKSPDTSLHSCQAVLASVVDSCKEFFVYPLPLYRDVSFYNYCCLVHIPSLQSLDYARVPILNEKRLCEFAQGKKEFRHLLHPLP